MNGRVHSATEEAYAGKERKQDCFGLIKYCRFPCCFTGIWKLIDHENSFILKPYPDQSIVTGEKALLLGFVSD